MFICWGGAKPPPQTPPPFVMTQINEIKRNTLPNFIYAFSMSTANLHSSLELFVRYWFVVFRLTRKHLKWHMLMRGITQFYRRPHLCRNEMSHPTFSIQLQHISALWPVRISCPTEGRWLSWSGWLVTYQDSMHTWWRSLIPVPANQ